ncbi:HPr-rel-A system PqqD family peptide chaperone [Amorphus sp. MBR-141]
MGQSFQRVDDIYAASLEDSVLLLNAETGRYHGLNPVASRIWDMLAEPVDEEQLVAGLTAEFEVSPEQCRREVADFLGQLRARGLLIDA